MFDEIAGNVHHKRLKAVLWLVAVVGFFLAVRAVHVGSVENPKSASLADMSARAEKSAFARQAAANGIVLLENRDAVLPLKAGEEIVLAGVTSYFCHRMGWGSGDMMDHLPVQYAEGLARAGVRIDADFAKLYRDFISDPVRATNVFGRINLDWWRWTSRFDEPDLYNERFAAFSKGKRAKKCVVTIGRCAGESADIPEAPGGYRLHWQEEFLLKSVCAAFDDVIVLLNVPGVIDLSFMDRYPVKGLVFAGLLGEVSGDAVADVLTGRVNPSAKTVDTWAKRYVDYPTTDCFETMQVPYREGIYVGYRHFDRCPGKVRYPFGYGLSYTTFTCSEAKVEGEGEPLKVSVKVANTGKVAGAEVVQVYLSLPQGKLDEPVKKLVAFQKTRVLKSGESVTLTIPFRLADAAAYSESEAAWVLEKGEYRVFVGNSARDVALAGAFNRDRDEIVARCRNLFAGRDYYTPRTPLVKRSDVPVTFDDVVAGRATAEDLAAQFTDEELVAMANGQIFDGQGIAVAGGTGVGGVTTGKVKCEGGEMWSSEKYALPAFTCADGPSGVRLGNFGDSKTNYNEKCALMFAWPCATAIAQGWDPAAAERFGRFIADDMRLSGIDGWLAPGVNIHRNPLCGRNFEYFSEDPLLAGLMGAAIVRGVQTQADGSPSGRYATVKHFCVNNQEFYRSEMDSLVSERALREIYLKPFEIVVKEAHPLSIMSSYNLLNGEHTATTYNLITALLRGEWGFDGFVMTDWWNAADKTRHPAAGNDVNMPGSRKDYNEMLVALKAGRIVRADLQHNAANMLRVFAGMAAGRIR